MKDISLTGVDKGLVASTIYIRGVGGTSLTLLGVPNDGAADVVAMIEKLRTPAQSGTSPTSSSQSIPSLIRELAELRDAGVVTEEEFQQKKAELMARL